MYEKNDEYWMDQAIKEAEKAMTEDEIPVGAILVKNGVAIDMDHNRTRELNSPLAHAEKLILDRVIKKEKYLYDYTLYITLEPCLMCAGMIISSRVGRIVFGAYDSKAGVAGSIYNVFYDKSFNHKPILTTRIKEKDCSGLLKFFFRNKRMLAESCQSG